MCGIYMSISTCGFQVPNLGLRQLLCSRGPDHTGESQVLINDVEGSLYLSFLSTVLALRGDQVTTQPFLQPQSGSIFCWNGEAGTIGSDPVTGNDGQAVFDRLTKTSSACKLSSDASTAVLEILRSIAGPFAFVYLDKIHNQIYLGRDRLGRRSLLYNASNPDFIEFASVTDTATGSSWVEVDADAIYTLACAEEGDFNLLQGQRWEEPYFSRPPLAFHRHAWHVADPSSSSVLGLFNRALPMESQTLDAQSASVKDLRHHLVESLKPRILTIPAFTELLGAGQTSGPRIAILFSGGLDCTVLARLSHDLLPLAQQIDLINVAFENPRAVQAAEKVSQSVNAQKIRNGNEASILLNTEYRIEGSVYESCPDRETGRRAFKELQEVCPGRHWRFVAVNIPYTETLAHRSNVIELMHPHNTEMDLSIAYAFYFAARGTGTEPEVEGSYTTPARVLLSGLGADELFGGYTRHATAFNRRGFEGLFDELELDIIRLGKRNLGRDDRIISHWAREARFPYLDERLIKWALETPIWEKCGFQFSNIIKQSSQAIEPGKKVLRLLAYELGMHSVAKESKRAIQFGARTAKMEGKTKGTAVVS